MLWLNKSPDESIVDISFGVNEEQKLITSINVDGDYDATQLAMLLAKLLSLIASGAMFEHCQQAIISIGDVEIRQKTLTYFNQFNEELEQNVSNNDMNSPVVGSLNVFKEDNL